MVAARTERRGEVVMRLSRREQARTDNSLVAVRWQQNPAAAKLFGLGCGRRLLLLANPLIHLCFEHFQRQRPVP